MFLMSEVYSSKTSHKCRIKYTHPSISATFIELARARAYIYIWLAILKLFVLEKEFGSLFGSSSMMMNSQSHNLINTYYIYATKDF